MNALLVIANGHRCPCGAVTEDTATTCRKCINRAKWRHRHNSRRRHAKRYRYASVKSR